MLLLWFEQKNCRKNKKPGLQKRENHLTTSHPVRCIPSEGLLKSWEPSKQPGAFRGPKSRFWGFWDVWVPYHAAGYQRNQAKLNVKRHPWKKPQPESTQKEKQRLAEVTRTRTKKQTANKKNLQNQNKATAPKKTKKQQQTST